MTRHDLDNARKVADQAFQRVMESRSPQWATLAEMHHVVRVISSSSDFEPDDESEWILEVVRELMALECNHARVSS